MKIRQLSLFLENRPGHLRVPFEALADTRQFGILRLVVKDPESARQVLEAAGSVVNVTDVVAIDVPCRPGGLAGVLAALLVRVADPDAAIPALRADGVELVPSDELFRRAGA